MKTAWFCEKCRTASFVEHDKDADVCSVINLIEDDHERMNVKCLFDPYSVRVEGLRSL